MSTRERQRRRRKRRSDPARLVLVGVIAVVTAFALVLTISLLYVSAVASNIPPLGKLKPVKQQTSTVIYAANGEQLGIVEGDSIRVPIRASQMPRILKEATVAIEDQRFYETGAIDLPSIIRAALADLITGKTVQGGSTIAMQLADNLYLGHQQTFERKVKEAVIAERLSNKMSKREILADYLNTVPYGTVGGQTAYGVQAAARMFFDRPASKLTLTQAALLAGLPQAPSQYNPFTYPQAARRRRNEVLTKLAELGYISAAHAFAAERAPLGVHHSGYFQERRYPYFFNYIATQLKRKYGASVAEGGGLKVYTTLDTHVQYLAQAAIRHVLVDPGDPASAEVVEDPHNGHILAMAQTGSYPANEINYATQILRQPGSTFKAIVLADALSRGIDPFTTDYLSHTLEPGWLPDYPTYTVSIDGGGNLDAPLDIEEALVASDNTVFAQLAADLGEQTVTTMAYKLGVTTHLDSYPAEALGGLTYGVSPLEMASVYSTLADGGWRDKQISITKVVFPNGRVDRSWDKVHRTKVFSSAADAVERQILEENVLEGTATQSAIDCPTAAKTGTTTNLVDAWLDGFTPNYTAVVWMGYPEGDIPMDDVQGEAQYGGDLPADIWHDTMETLATPPCASFPSAPAMDYVAFSGRYQQAGLATYVPPKKHKHHTGKSNGGGGTTTPTAPATTTPAPTQPPTGAT
ncbi:MAG TPA: transglycosylase domain-containing protein [Solirubrobacteraceae bacterium]|nr:transglycosylase domain-containing protein [Solirubrobacteraceae bacterium]